MARIRDACEGLGPRGFLLCGGYSLYLAFGYMSFESSMVLVSGGLAEAMLPSVFLISVIAARIATYAAVAFVSCRRTLKIPSCATLSCAACVMGFVILGMLVQFSKLVPARDMTPWLAFSGAAFGVAGSLLGVLWMRFAASLSLRAVYLFAMLSNLTSLGVYALAMLAPSFLHVPLCAVLFILSLWCALRCLTTRPERETSCERPAFSGAWAVLWRPVAATSVLAFMGGFMLQMAQWHPIPLDVFQSTSLLTQGAVVAVLLVPAIVVKKTPALEAVYKTALPLSAAGFLLLPVVWNGAGGLANACAQLGALVAGVILWCMTADAARVRGVSSSLLYSACMVCTQSAQLAGTLFGFARAEYLQPGDVALTAVSLVALYAVSMVSTFLFKDRRFKGGTDGASGGEVAAYSDAHGVRSEFAGGAESAMLFSAEELRAKQRADFECRCAAVADGAGLTPREREVFMLAVRGKTNAAVAEELVVSENTVKFHVKSIYQKLGVHSKADMLALVGDAGE